MSADWGPYGKGEEPRPSPEACPHCGGPQQEIQVLHLSLVDPQGEGLQWMKACLDQACVDRRRRA